jgi:peptidoglycan/xylan/chitin deacetylase (PgdA/CDA1 family)
MTHCRVSVTFDDGLASVYSIALPEMERLGLRGTVFVISDLIGGEYMGHAVATKKMLLSLSSAGWEIGSHTKTHPRLVELSTKQLNTEFELSNKQLSSMIGRPVTTLAYPYGEFDNRVGTIAASHYRCARALSCYPPLRLNSLVPRNKLKLEAMSSIEPSSSLPLHLYSRYVPKPVKRTLHRVISRYTQNTRGDAAVGRMSLTSRVVTKWLKKKNRWLILCFHNLTPGRTMPPYDIKLHEFREIVRTISAEAEVMTIEEGLATGEEPVHGLSERDPRSDRT